MAYGNGSGVAMNSAAMGVGAAYRDTVPPVGAAGAVQQALGEHEHELSELGSAILELEKRLCAVLASVPPEPSSDAANKQLSSSSISGRIADCSRAICVLRSRVGSMLQRLEL
jgi:hypothetical protein